MRYEPRSADGRKTSQANRVHMFSGTNDREMNNINQDVGMICVLVVRPQRTCVNPVPSNNFANLWIGKRGGKRHKRSVLEDEQVIFVRVSAPATTG